MRWFAAWLLVGAGYAFALLALLSIGILVLPAVILLTLVLARHPGTHRGLPGAVSGLGLPLLYVAYLNRSGPGTICTPIPNGQSCTDQSNPAPWLAVALILVLAGVVTAVILRRRPRVDRPETEREAV